MSLMGRLVNALSIRVSSCSRPSRNCVALDAHLRIHRKGVVEALRNKRVVVRVHPCCQVKATLAKREEVEAASIKVMQQWSRGCKCEASRASWAAASEACCRCRSGARPHSGIVEPRSGRKQPPPKYGPHTPRQSLR